MNQLGPSNHLSNEEAIGNRGWNMCLQLYNSGAPSLGSAVSQQDSLYAYKWHSTHSLALKDADPEPSSRGFPCPTIAKRTLSSETLGSSSGCG